MIVKELLQKGIKKLNENEITEPILKARIVLSFILGVKKEYLVINFYEEVDKKIEIKFYEKIDEIVQGKPLQYITHHQEFMKMNFYVDENVLIPRQDTETLVEEVINFCDNERKYKILDLCTGSGAIGISIAKYISNSYIVCSDISEKALEVAKKNATLNNIKNIEFRKSDLLKNIEGKFDIVVSNPPYIKRKEITKLNKDVQFEPHQALDGGIDGLDFYRKIIDNVYEKLEPKGAIFLEIGYDQKQDVINLLEEKRIYKKIYGIKDLGGNDRVIIALL